MVPLITLLTDFGSADHYVAAMKGVIAGICPEARMIDISHEMQPYAVAEAAFTLAQAAKCFPPDTIHLVVVDPGVGGSRRPILVESGGYRFVGPDNGVFEMAIAGNPVVREIKNDQYFRTPVSHTFHGRDIFAPIAAHLAKGVRAGEFGQPIADWVRLFEASGARVLKVDRYGNIITNLPAQLVGKEGLRIEVGSQVVTESAASYAESHPGSLFAIAGSSGFLEISIDRASAAAATGVKSGDPIRLNASGI
jgi:S-adenosylmethionine hydrolase